MGWLTYFYDFRFKWTATTAIGIHPGKAWLSKLVYFKNTIWHFRRTICNKIMFKLWKNATETYGMLQTAFRQSWMNRPSVFVWHKRFKEGRESVKDDERCGRSKQVNAPELIGQRLGLELLCWGFKGVQKEIPSECYVLTCWPGQKYHSRWCTGRKWHILVIVMRGNHVGGNWLMRWDEVKKNPIILS